MTLPVKEAESLDDLLEKNIAALRGELEMWESAITDNVEPRPHYIPKLVYNARLRVLEELRDAVTDNRSKWTAT